MECITNPTECFSGSRLPPVGGVQRTHLSLADQQLASMEGCLMEEEQRRCEQEHATDALHPMNERMGAPQMGEEPGGRTSRYNWTTSCQSECEHERCPHDRIRQAAAGLWHRLAHQDRRPAVSPQDATRGAAAHREPPAEGDIVKRVGVIAS
jgi:hypothetical protein